MNKVELFECIRKAHLREGKSIRSIARLYKIHRRVVRAALANAIPPTRKQADKKQVKLHGQIKAAINKILESDRDAPKKQRHTAARIYQRLVKEHDYQGALPTIKYYVGQRRRALGTSARAFVPQVYQPAKESEVDWYEAKVKFPWGEEAAQIFQMRACFSGKAFHRAYPRQTQQAFLEGHAHAFKFFGGVFPIVRYDNLTSAVKKVLQGRKRLETERFVALRSHYLFEAVFCKVGIEG